MTETPIRYVSFTLRTWKQYPEYKDSGIEWLGEIPAHWEIRRLKNVVDLRNEKVFSIDSGKPYIGMENVEPWTGRLLDTDLEVTGAAGTFEAGDVLFGKLRPYLAKAILASTSGQCSSEFLVIKPKAVFGCFLHLLVLSDGFVRTIDSATYGTKMPRANWETVGGIGLAIPEISEQRAIADFLNRETAKIDALVEKKEQLIGLLQEKRTALITHAVTKGLDPDVPMKDSGIEWLGKTPAHWEVWKIKHLAQVKRGASPRPIDDPIYFDDEGQYSWVRIADLTASQRYLERTTQRLSKLGQSKSVCLEPGELFVSIAASIGKPIITHIKCCIHDGFVYFKGLRPNAEFVWYLLQCGEAYRGLGKLGTQLNLNTDTVGGISVPLPDSAEQQLLVDFLDRETARIDALIAKVREATERLKEYRTALISATVTGKIDVRGFVEDRDAGTE